MKCNDLWEIFLDEKIAFFTGIPDSTFSQWMKYLDMNNGKGLTNIIASNECEAIAIASGYYLATQEIGVVYMQNSGLGKAVNPLTSLADPAVYSIPMILMIGWRGEPGKKDEPQHSKIGRIMLSLLDVLEIPYSILPDDVGKIKKIIKDAKDYVQETNSQYALIIRKGIIESFNTDRKKEEKFEISREEAIKLILENVSSETIIVSTTGKTSRELFDLRVSRKEEPRDFYTVGSMGCASSIAFGIATNTKKDIFVLDGDGSVIMQMGSLATIGHYKPSNLYHVIFDNRSYESTGGQPTVSTSINFENIGISCGYKTVSTVSSKVHLQDLLLDIKEKDCPYLLIVNVKKGSRVDLGRPTTPPKENKENFMKTI